jgi:hypothetical protein
MPRQPLNWIDLAATARSAPGVHPSEPCGNFKDRLWARLEAEPVSLRPRSASMATLTWCAAASLLLAVAVVGINRDLLDLTHDPNSPLIDELAVTDWTALDAAL